MRARPLSLTTRPGSHERGLPRAAPRRSSSARRVAACYTTPRLWPPTDPSNSRPDGHAPPDGLLAPSRLGPGLLDRARDGAGLAGHDPRSGPRRAGRPRGRRHDHGDGAGHGPRTHRDVRVRRQLRHSGPAARRLHDSSGAARVCRPPPSRRCRQRRIDGRGRAAAAGGGGHGDRHRLGRGAAGQHRREQESPASSRSRRSSRCR